MKQSLIISRSVTGTMLVCFPEKSLLIILFIMELLLLLLEAIYFICLVSNTFYNINSSFQLHTNKSLSGSTDYYLIVRKAIQHFESKVYFARVGRLCSTYWPNFFCSYNAWSFSVINKILLHLTHLILTSWNLVGTAISFIEKWNI